MKLTKLKPKFVEKHNPRIGLITLASDFRIEKDFNELIYDKDVDLYCNRIKSYNPLTIENLKKMANDITKVTKDILPDQKLDCVAYGCTSGTIASGFSSIERKIKNAKPLSKVTTPSSAAISALKKLNIKKISIFTPYPKKLNDEVVSFFKNEKFDVTANVYLDIETDSDIWKVDPDFLYEVLINLDHAAADAVFISCTALPVLQIIKKLETNLNKFVLSSNQVLIWDTLEKIGQNNSITGFGKLFTSN